jgi:hypothetical protein
MALVNLSFSETGNNWTSEIIVPSTSDMAVGVKFPNTGKPGAVIVEQTIDGENWTLAGQIVGRMNDTSYYVLKNVCGFVVGTSFRIVISTEPESIKILLN